MKGKLWDRDVLGKRYFETSKKNLGKRQYGPNYNEKCKCYRFMAVPFVFELRTLMDWMWTDTSMTLMDWLKMEDIFANVFLLKVTIPFNV